MIFRSKEDGKSVFSNFFLSGVALKEFNEIKYLGHYMTNDMYQMKRTCIEGVESYTHKPTCWLVNSGCVQ